MNKRLHENPRDLSMQELFRVEAENQTALLTSGARLIDAATGADVAVVDDLGVTTVPLEPLGALALVLR